MCKMAPVSQLLCGAAQRSPHPHTAPSLSPQCLVLPKAHTPALQSAGHHPPLISAWHRAPLRTALLSSCRYR